ncbi:polysaccharide biosynthesis/export family protein [Prochlorococcus sp. MIT 1307]|uniref:polysaccharide biosynthesis/export family protein n=1 Tax=Prochlorococcus sp. MIT 1307 TaxID=3096219 RepID=UPI002A761165|nr:polysaccharide biosynthesis/export family protein [Prochlorococcus sp. MIT 1307]
MNIQKIKILGLQFLLLNQMLLVDLYKPKQISAAENTNQPSSDYIKQIPDSSYYILGPGDVLSLKVAEEATNLNKIFNINGEGIANLQRLNRIYASGLTIGELTEILNKEYSAYVNEPDVQLLMVRYRPVKVYIDGEVEEPGLYVLKGESSPFELLEEEEEEDADDDKWRQFSDIISVKTKGLSTLDRSVFFPTLIDAIRKSGGITMYSDLTNIKVTRINSISEGSGRIGTKVNLIETLDLKDNSQNLRLLDGDTIFVSKSNKPILSQISKAIKSNLNPKFIDVYLGGRVEKPGVVTVSKVASLTEAIEIGGGAKVLKGPVTFLRYNSDGKIDRRKFGLRASAPRGSYKNPFLRDGDVIYIGKSLLNVTTEVVTEITAPLQGLVSAYGFYKILTDE